MFLVFLRSYKILMFILIEIFNIKYLYFVDIYFVVSYLFVMDGYKLEVGKVL